MLVKLRTIEFAEMAGVTERTLRLWLKEKPLEPLKRGGPGVSTVYDMVACHNYLLERALGHKEGLDLQAERARLAAEQADSYAMKNAIQKKQLAPTEKIAETIEKAAAQIVPVLESIPLQVKRRLPEIPAAGIQLIKKEIAKACNIISEMRLEND